LQGLEIATKRIGLAEVFEIGEELEFSLLESLMDGERVSLPVGGSGLSKDIGQFESWPRHINRPLPWPWVSAWLSAGV
jgi:hypothetical protein